MNGLFFHEHGGRVAAGGQKLLDFSVSISPVSPFQEPLVADIAEQQSYPSIDGKDVRNFYSHRFALDKTSVLALNGAVEGIYLLPRALGIRSMLLLAPSFYEYERAARIAGAETGFMNLAPDDGFRLPPIEDIVAVLERYDAFFAANPNNPTGTIVLPEIVMALATRFPGKWFFVDEAFVQFLPEFPDCSLMPHVAAFPNIVVVHSLTKFYALPGLRLGALVAHPATITRLYGFKEPWAVNALAEKAARQLFESQVYESTLCKMISDERERIAAAFPSVPDVRLAGGAANFFLAEWRGPGTLDDLLAHLLSQGIVVRDCRNFSGLRDRYFRFAVRTPGDNTRLLDALFSASSSLQRRSAESHVGF